MRNLTIQELEILIVSMKEAQTEHPKAKVLFDMDTNEIKITYPFPKDFPMRIYLILNIKIISPNILTTYRVTKANFQRYPNMWQ